MHVQGKLLSCLFRWGWHGLLCPVRRQDPRPGLSVHPGTPKRSAFGGGPGER
ncbi:hypothetical protein LptCag_1706 [Leptospirillum ferriphilum]|uniref:Uncharacterized protein n=2 Tax=Leptospirillum ferriphilum TaxID=178606 RepID=A0A094WB32_9BACT|nr:hypothetical protein LFML04_1728 [Leptospirillum ferriphilum ML-04]KGA92872.1 hypothetical protein LptCag_1706 [Leptospirillum ferriphilum]